MNFDKKLLIVESSLPRKARKYEKLSIVPGDDAIFIKAVCKTKDQVLKTHSCYIPVIPVLYYLMTALLQNIHRKTDTHYRRKNWVMPAEILSPQRKGSFRFFQLGTQNHFFSADWIFEGALGRQTISVIGGDIIRRFNWVIDRKKGYVYIKKKITHLPFFQPLKDIVLKITADIFRLPGKNK